ncbi:2'-5' RNA ligase family protein [Gleimia hominis]|uniref:2'-5' RNA ligase family protein n=1 Tax=Gleimia hominis TaxID=595468 RepID=A0ABU3IF38_9ACTO|nr:2'-5' RNA ligase family protein [Gleimia hominis]MDT3767855.1 2'-5' RNA ligase family protein [Gleimia hominis]
MYLPQPGPDEEVIGVLIPVPEPWRSQLTNWRLQFGDPLANQVVPHITLLPPTVVKVAERVRVRQHLQKAAAGSVPFQITLRGTGTFQPVSPVVYIQVVGGVHELVALESDIRSGVLDRPTRFPYHPHVTVAQSVPPEQLDFAAQECADFEASWVARSLHLDTVSAGGAYESRALFELNS